MRFMFTWAIEDRHGATTFYSEVVECENWEQHVAHTIPRQQDDGSGRFTAPWRLVFINQVFGSEIKDALECGE